jgi:hypothetical protein
MRSYPIIPVGAWWAGLAVIVASMVSMVGLSKVWVITSAVFNSIAASVAIAGAVVDGLGTVYTRREDQFHLYNLTCVTVALCCCMVCITTVQIAFNVIAVYKAEEDEMAANDAANQYSCRQYPQVLSG